MKTGHFYCGLQALSSCWQIWQSLLWSIFQTGSPKKLRKRTGNRRKAFRPSGALPGRYLFL